MLSVTSQMGRSSHFGQRGTPERCQPYNNLFISRSFPGHLFSPFQFNTLISSGSEKAGQGTLSSLISIQFPNKQSVQCIAHPSPHFLAAKWSVKTNGHGGIGFEEKYLAITHEIKINSIKVE